MAKIIHRHADTLYLQGRVPLDQANDITPEGEQKIRKVALWLPNYLRSGAKIISSDYGRTQIGALITQEELAKVGIETTLEINPEIGDVEFEYELYLALQEGGFDEQTQYNIQRGLTNFPNYSFEEYFHRSIPENFPEEVRRCLPQNILDRIANFETCPEAGNRFKNVVESCPDNTLLMTHEATSWEYAKRTGMALDEFLKRGHFLVLEPTDNYQVPTYFSQAA